MLGKNCQVTFYRLQGLMRSNTSNSTDIPPWTCETRIGITLVAEAATLSFLSVASLLAYLSYQTFKHRKKPEAKLIRCHLDLYLLGLLFSDLIQAIGGMMDIQWVARSGVFQGRYCIVQGFLEQFGDVGVALCTLAISIHTFTEIVLQWREPKDFILPKIMLSLFVLFLILITTVGYSIHRNNNYYGNTVYWCWITKKYLAEGIALEYAWMWLTATLNLVFYLVAFLILERYIIVERTVNGRYHVYATSRKERVDLRRFKSHVPPHRLLYFPAAYIVTVIPVAVVRIHSFVASTDSVPFPATVLGGMFFSAGGFYNVMVYTLTRPGLLRYTRRAAVSRRRSSERASIPALSPISGVYLLTRPEQVALPMKSPV